MAAVKLHDTLLSNAICFNFLVISCAAEIIWAQTSNMYKGFKCYNSLT